MTAGAVPPEPSTSASLACLWVQNRTQPPPTIAVLGSPCLQVWDKASTVRVSLGTASWAIGRADPDARLLEAPTASLEGATVLGTVTDAPTPTRSPVTALSPGSRSRLMQKLGTIDATAPALFVTLTWPRDSAPDAKQWHQAWDRWRMRLQRAWPMAAGIWRREFTRAGVVHLHLLTFNVPMKAGTIKTLRDWTAKAWADSVDAPGYDKRLRAGTSVEVPRSGRAVSRYIAKYASKLADGDGTDRPMGRWWGTFGGETKIPYTLPLDVPLTDAEAVMIRRTMERWLQSKRRERARVTGRRVKGRPPRPRHSRRIYTDNPTLWLRLLDSIREPSQAPPVGASRRVREGEAGAWVTSSSATRLAVQTQGI